MLDGAETILREEGYAELTSRRIASHIGVKQQLVFYYFRNMEELIVAAFRRLGRRELERLEAALRSNHPLHDIWDVCINTSDARLIAEFMALSHRSASLREEVVAHIERTRRLHVEALTKAFQASKGGFAALPPAAISFLASSAALALNREGALGISMGHAEVLSLLTQSLARLEAEVAEADRPRR